MFEKYISKGIAQPIQELHGHKRADFIKRLLLMSSDIVPEARCHISVNVIDGVPRSRPAYAGMHAHTCDEVYLVLGEKNKLKYKIVLGNETHTVASPAAVFVPRRLPHMAEAIAGRGQFIAVLLSGNREASLLFK